jgi:pimeloyl-ACP methyl ester carboxylesterase
LTESAALFAQHMSGLREVFPRMRVDVIAHSMGGLVARDYIEGREYAGGIERLILIAPPNQGSKWAGYRLLLEAEEHYKLWRDEPTWNWTWMITDGLGEAGRDLKPDSDFLRELNERPRRDGVKYTIIAGTRHPGNRMAARCLDKTASWIPDRVSHWWGIRHCGRAIERAAERFETKVSDSDGPVAIDSTQLAGVEDVVLLHADHTSIYYGGADGPPGAWESVRDRLAQ